MVELISVQWERTAEAASANIISRDRTDPGAINWGKPERY